MYSTLHLLIPYSSFVPQIRRILNINVFLYFHLFLKAECDLEARQHEGTEALLCAVLFLWVNAKTGPGLIEMSSCLGHMVEGASINRCKGDTGFSFVHIEVNR